MMETPYIDSLEEDNEELKDDLTGAIITINALLGKLEEWRGSYPFPDPEEDTVMAEARAFVEHAKTMV